MMEQGLHHPTQPDTNYLLYIYTKQLNEPSAHEFYEFYVEMRLIQKHQSSQNLLEP